MFRGVVTFGNLDFSFASNKMYLSSLGVGADGDMWETMDLLLERMKGKVEVNWMRGHEDKRTRTRRMGKHQSGNVKADQCQLHRSQEGGEEQGQVAAAQEEVLEAVL